MTTMDFDVLEDQYNDERIENGAWLHLNGSDGEPAYRDAEKTQPCRALVRSILSTHYDKMGDDALKSMSSKARRLKSEDQRRLAALKEMKEQQPKAVSVLVAAFDNVSKAQGGTIRPGPADLMVFASRPKNKPWVEQIIEFAGDNSNYGGDASPEVEAGKAAGADSTADPSAPSS